MKIQNVFLVTAVSGMMTLCSCGKEVINENSMERNSRLTVLTRSDGEGSEAAIALPVRLYVFNEEGDCIGTQVREAAETPIEMELPKGTYDIVAIGGADEDRLQLPSQENAEMTSVISLRQGQTLGDLMTAHSNITLASESNNTLSLIMERKVCQIVSVAIHNVPEDAEEVSVSISPLYESILLNGSYHGENGTYTFPLKKQDGTNTWKEDSSDLFLLPSVGNATISVSIGDSTYSYDCNAEIASNYKISIEGMYTGPSSITLSGTITGTSWAGEESIRFNFNEEGSETVPSSRSGDL